jgi:RNA polymerase sigma-70 factor (ECF subfamily)
MPGEPGHQAVDASSPDSIVDLALVAGESTHLAADAEALTLALFDRYATALLRYAGSFGLGANECEDIVQEAFLALFRHVSLGRGRSNLAGWLFRVAHNLALKRRKIKSRRARDSSQASILNDRFDPGPSPEMRLALTRRRARLRAIVKALPERERCCLFLRAEGLTYRDIASALSLSLGMVAKSLARTIARLATVDRE